MKIAEILLAVLAFVTGMTATWYWYQASGVRIDRDSGHGTVPQSGVHSAEQDAWIVALIQAGIASARLNKIAATWTAITVALTAITTILSAL